MTWISFINIYIYIYIYIYMQLQCRDFILESNWVADLYAIVVVKSKVNGVAYCLYQPDSEGVYPLFLLVPDQGDCFCWGGAPYLPSTPHFTDLYTIVAVKSKVVGVIYCRYQLVGWLFLFYGISTFLGHLMPIQIIFDIVTYSTCSCLNGHPFKDWTGSSLLNFGNLAGTGAFNVTWS